MEFIAYGDDYYDIFGMADSLTTLYFDNKQYCGSSKLMKQLFVHCKTPVKPADSTIYKCSPTQLAHNLSGEHLIEAMGAMSILTETYKEFDIHVDSDDMHEQTNQLGTALGNFIALAINF